eukprot:Tbor_TRINITY_DN5856_c0_g1::TRINITY_DN5856_c0_g1_i1::g.6606::m.6606
MRLCVCYKKSDQSKYVLVPGSIAVRPKVEIPKAKPPAVKPSGTPESEPAPPKIVHPTPDPPKLTPQTEPKKKDEDEGPVNKEIPVPPNTENEAKTDPPKNAQVSPKKKDTPPHKPETPKDPKQ